MEPGRCDVMTRGDATLDAMYRATRPNAVVESRRDHACGELCRGGGAADPRSVTDARRKRPTDLGMLSNAPFSRVFEPRVLGKFRACLVCASLLENRQTKLEFSVNFRISFFFQLDDELELRLRRRLLLPLLLDDGERPRPRPPPPRLGGGGDLLRRLPPTLPPPPPRPRPRLLLRLLLLDLERLDRDRDLLEYDRE